MKRTIALAFVILGLGIGILGLTVLPAGHGRFEYLVEILDERSAKDAIMPDSLRELGATMGVVVVNPTEGARPERVVLLKGLPSLIRTSECALGEVPKEPGWQGLAGFDSGLERGTIALNGHELTICGQLQALAPAFDRAVVMEYSERIDQELSDVGWEAEIRYFVVPKSWPEQQELLAKMDAAKTILPAGATTEAHGSKPILSGGQRVALSVVLIGLGLFVLGWQMRGLRREDIVRRFGGAEK